MKKITNITFSVLLTASLVACIEDTKKSESSNSSYSSKSSSSEKNISSSSISSTSYTNDSSVPSSSRSSTSSASNTVPLASFTSSIIGDHSVLTNAIIKDLIAEYPLFSAIPALVKIKKKEELEAFISDSQALGFNKEQFDTLYQATFIVMEAIRLSYLDDFINPDTSFNTTPISDFQDKPSSPSMEVLQTRIRVKLEESNTYTYENLSNYLNDMQEKDLPASPIDETSSDISIRKTRTPGRAGKGDKYTFKSDQQFLLPGCQLEPEDCSLHIEVFTTLDFPTRNVTLGISGDYSALNFTDVQISATRFKISNHNASLDFSLNPKKTFTINATHYRKGHWPETLISMEILSEYGSGSNRNTRSNIKGRFTNTYADDNGNTREIQVTGSMIGDIENMLFTANYNSETPIEPSPSALMRPESFSNIEAELKGRMSGLIEGANLEVNFVTEAVE